MPSSPGHAAACARSAGRSNRPSAGNASTPFGAPPSRMRTVSARVSTPGHTGDPARPQPGVQMLRRPPVGRLGDVLLHHQAARRDRGGLDVLAVGADIADMREGEGDDLSGVGRVGQRLLIAGHAGVEADLAHRRRRPRYGRRSRGPRTPCRRPAPARRWRPAAPRRHRPTAGSARGAAGPPGRSDSARPVAAITAAQWRDGIDPAWRHLRTASVPRRSGARPPRRRPAVR